MTTTEHDWIEDGCPNGCEGGEVTEHAIRFTAQRATFGDYDSFDYDDEPYVLGWTCDSCHEASDDHVGMGQKVIDLVNGRS